MPEQHSGKRGQSMDYKLVISEHADELLNNLVYYLLYRLKSEQAARHLLDGIDGIYLSCWRAIASPAALTPLSCKMPTVSSRK